MQRRCNTEYNVIIVHTFNIYIYIYIYIYIKLSRIYVADDNEMHDHGLVKRVHISTARVASLQKTQRIAAMEATKKNESENARVAKRWNIFRKFRKHSRNVKTFRVFFGIFLESFFITWPDILHPFATLEITVSTWLKKNIGIRLKSSMTRSNIDKSINPLVSVRLVAFQCQLLLFLLRFLNMATHMSIESVFFDSLTFNCSIISTTGCQYYILHL